MFRARVLAVLGVVGCSARPLPVGATDHDGGSMSGVDLGSPVDAVAHDAHGAADILVSADSRAPTDAPISRDAGSSTDSGVSDGRCSPNGNGHAPQPSPLFRAPVTSKLPPLAITHSVAIGDVTGDGRADVIVTADDLGIVVYPQTASGLLDVPIGYPIPAGDTPADLDVGDVNGDGLLDVVYTRTSGVGVLLGNLSGRLDPVRPFEGTQGGSGELVVAVADLNGDGRSDIVAAGWGASGVDVWFQDQAGSLSEARTFACPHNGEETMAVGDIDGDGLVDILISGLAQTDVCVLLQGPGGFAPAISIPTGATYISGLAVGDFGVSDCRPEIAFTVSVNRPMSKLGLMGLPTSPGAPTLLDSYDNPRSSVVADVDGDGRDDIVLVHVGWNAVGVYRGLPSGGVAAEERYPFSNLGGGGDLIAVGDINGDGRPDVVGVVNEYVTILYHQ